MWFQTATKTNQNTVNSIKFMPIKVLEMWECKKCMNIIFSKKYTFSPLAKEEDVFVDSWSLENVLIKIEQNRQSKTIKSQIQNQEFQMINQLRIYCKVCDNTILGEFKPILDIQHCQFKYDFICKNENVKKSKIIMGKSNIPEISNKNSKILKQNNSIDNLTVLRHVCGQINKYVALWYYSKNIKIYRPFISESKNARQNLMDMKGFMIKTKSRNQKNERQSIRMRFKQSSCSNNSASMTI